MLAHAGLSVNTVKLVDVDMDLTQALMSGQVDAAAGMMRNVEPVQMAQMGVRTRLFLPEAFGVPPYSELIVIGNRKINPDTVRRFNYALQEGVNDLYQHPVQDWQLISQDYGPSLAPTVQAARTNQAIWMQTLPYFARNVTAFNPMQVQQFIDFMAQQGALPRAMPWRTLLLKL